MPGSSKDFLDMFTGMGGKGMDGEQKRLSDMRGMNGMQFNSGERSQGDQEAQQRMMQNMMTAHHTGGGVGLDGFKEPSLEDLVEMVREGKIGKEVLGPDADIMLQYGTPSQREKQLEDTGSLEIPVMPYEDDEDDDTLSFLKAFIRNA